MVLLRYSEDEGGDGHEHAGEGELCYCCFSSGLEERARVRREVMSSKESSSKSGVLLLGLRRGFR